MRLLHDIIKEALENAYENGYLYYLNEANAIDLAAELYESGIIARDNIIASIKIIQELKDAKDSIFGY